MSFFVISLDPFLGRADKSALSQQSLMEILVENLTNRESICGLSEEPTDVTTWRGITVDDSLEVTSIDWCSYTLYGSFSFELIPPSVRSLNIHSNELSGTLPMKDLPHGLVDCNIRENSFRGTLDLDALLPKSLIWLSRKIHSSGLYP